MHCLHNIIHYSYVSRKRFIVIFEARQAHEAHMRKEERRRLREAKAASRKHKQQRAQQGRQGAGPAAPAGEDIASSTIGIVAWRANKDVSPTVNKKELKHLLERLDSSNHKF